MRTRIALLALLALAACSSGGAAPRGSSAPERSAPRPPASPPPVRLQTGTDSVAGILASWCTGRKCSTPAGAAPKRWLPLDEQGLMLFATGIEPESASVEVRARGHRVAKGRIEPATLMTWRAHLPRGRYVVTLIERWDDRVARWLFGVKVEPPND